MSRGDEVSMYRLRDLIVVYVVFISINVGGISGLLLAMEYLLSIFWVIAFVLGLFLLPRLAFSALTGDFVGNIDLSPVEREWVVIPTTRDGYVLHGLSYKRKSDLGARKPYVIVGHGAGGDAEQLDMLAVPLVLAGFHVMLFNQSGHGKKPHVSSGNGKLYPEVMVNVHDVTAYVSHLDDIDTDGLGPRIGFVGHSTGGVMALSQAYLNPLIRVTIALSGVHDFTGLVQMAGKFYKRFSPPWMFKASLQLSGFKLDYSDEENRVISPRHCLERDPRNARRVFMVHAEDDVLPIKEAILNQLQAGVPITNCLYLSKGGHNFRGQETLIVSQVVSWFVKHL